jgi:hypothetical protein
MIGLLRSLDPRSVVSAGPCVLSALVRLGVITRKAIWRVNGHDQELRVSSRSINTFRPLCQQWHQFLGLESGRTQGTPMVLR